MSNEMIFSAKELEKMDNWSIFSQRPIEISPEKWSFAIENELTSEIYEHYDVIDGLKTGKPNAYYISQRDFIILALKAISFEKCPKIMVNNIGQIYIFGSYGECGVFLPQFKKDGELSFIGNGNVYIITPESQNKLAIIYFNVETKEHEINYLHKNKFIDADSKKLRIKLKNV